MADLLADYVSGAPPLLENYAATPQAVLEQPTPPLPWDNTLAGAVREYQTHLGAPKSVNAMAPVYITGQQPGIFTGPLYTIYKAITAIQLAERAEARSGNSAIPMYWVGGDDHDFDEIARVHLLTKAHESLPLHLAPAPDQHATSIFRLPVRPELHDLVEIAASEAPGSEHRDAVRGFLHDSLDAAGNLSEWHARLMARLFRDTPLVLFTPDLPEARRAAAPVFEREIQAPLASTERVNDGGARMENAGYDAQVVKDDSSCNFFLERDGQRCRVQFSDGAFHLPDTRERFSVQEMQQQLRDAPEQFTANVALRCIVQQHLFPVQAYVAGPGELAYWGQLKGLFNHFDTPMPVVYPRIRAVLTTIKTNKLMEKLGLRTADLDAPFMDLEERALRHASRHPGLDVFEARRAEIRETLQALESDLESLGRPGRGAADTSRQLSHRVERELERFERNLLHSDDARRAAIRSQLTRLTTERMPERKQQERYYTIFSWLFEYGWDLIPRLMEALDSEEFGLQEVEL